MPAVAERHRVGAGGRIGEIGQRDLSPCAASVAGPRLEHALRSRPAHCLQAPVAVEQDARLDGVQFGRAVGDGRTDESPGLASVGRSFEVHAPEARLIGRLGAAGADDGAVGQPHRLVFDRTEHSVREAQRGAPRSTAVARRHRHAPPRARAWPDLVEEADRSVGVSEEDRVPARVARTVRLDARRDLARRRPRTLHVARQPDADVGGALARAPEPRRDEAVGRFDERRRVHARKGRGLEEELIADPVGIRHQRVLRARADHERTQRSGDGQHRVSHERYSQERGTRVSVAH